MKKILLLLMALYSPILPAQWAEEYYQPTVQPRLYVGGDVAAFRISLRDFKDVYESKWGESYGAFIGVRAFGSHYIALRYGGFNQAGKDGIHPATGENLSNAAWQERWYKIGLRIHPPVEKRLGSYYGFGLGFFDVKEKEPISIFDFDGIQNDSFSGSGSGFYLELGIDYFVTKNFAAFFDVEIASGGTHGRSSFEAMSVGGWRFSTGLAIWPF